MTFRRLTTEELVPLEKKFIQFLVANTITGDDWAKMKERRPEQALGLIDIFSDLMFEETLKKVKFLKLAEPKELKIFHCLDDKIELLGLVAHKNTSIDFVKDENWLQNLSFNAVEDPETSRGGISIYKTEKTYSEARELEIFKMIENGCRITDNYLHDILKPLV